MAVFIIGGLAVIFFGVGMWLHDFQTNRKLEIMFFCLALTACMVFFWLLGQNLLKEIGSILRNNPRL
jgi:hypothetical protein